MAAFGEADIFFIQEPRIMGKDTTENSIPVCPEENGTIDKKNDAWGVKTGITVETGLPNPRKRLLWVQQRTFWTGITGKTVTPAPVLHPTKE